ncbi:MAG TPA: hypothetical protein VNH53_09990 [Sphingomicrobium sp.]|jgi:hypothetical protein|nr:hypothetical protein [Sphingomicrobium sp.]
MRYSTRFLALGAAFAAGPALAQVNVGVGGQADVGVNVGVGVDPAPVVDRVTGTLDRTVDTLDRTVNRTVAQDLRIATRADVRAGAEVRDNRGNRVGTVHSVHGDMVMVVRGNRALHVPLAALYRGSRGLVTSLSRAEIEAAAAARARGQVHGSTRN